MESKNADHEFEYLLQDVLLLFWARKLQVDQHTVLQWHESRNLYVTRSSSIPVYFLIPYTFYFFERSLWTNH